MSDKMEKWELQSYLVEKSQQCTAYLQGQDTADIDHHDHKRNIERAIDRARDILETCQEYIVALEDDELDAALKIERADHLESLWEEPIDGVHQYAFTKNPPKWTDG